MELSPTTSYHFHWNEQLNIDIQLLENPNHTMKEVEGKFIGQHFVLKFSLSQVINHFK
jgi:hypothetical protein